MQNKTYIALVLDQSGSMETMKQAVIDEFNKQLKVIQAMVDATMEVVLSLVTFDFKHEAVIWNKSVNDINPLLDETYKPNGGTALNDAVGWTIKELQKVPDANSPDVAFLVTIISDGEENASREISATTLAEMIQDMQKLGNWTFTYIGANQDLSKVTAQMNIPAGNVMAFAASAGGYTAMSASNIRSTDSYLKDRLSGKKMKSNFYTDTTDAEEQDDKTTA